MTRGLELATTGVLTHKPNQIKILPFCQDSRYKQINSNGMGDDEDPRRAIPDASCRNYRFANPTLIFASSATVGIAGPSESVSIAGPPRLSMASTHLELALQLSILVRE